jgi:aminopeptidase 2
MDTWTSKIGYPIVTISEQGKGEITVRQNRYLTTGDVKPEDDTVVYPLSLRIRTKSGIQNVTMTEREMTIKLDDADADFYKINADHAGVFRVKYPAERVSKLSKAGVDGLLSVEDRVGLVADIASTSMSGYIPTSSLLELVSQWKAEDSPNVWKEVLARLAALRGGWLFEPQEVRDALKSFSSTLVLPKAKQTGWTFTESDSLLDQMLKGELFATAVSLEDEEFVKEALDMFAKYAAGDTKAIDPNLRQAVFRAAGKYGDAATWQRLVDVYKSPSSGTDGNIAIAALGLSKDIALKKKTLEVALDGTIRTQDIFYALAGFRVDQESAALVWQWLQDNWDVLVDKFPPSLGMFSAISKDRIQAKVSWLNRDRAVVEQWLRDNKFLN